MPPSITGARLRVSSMLLQAAVAVLLLAGQVLGDGTGEPFTSEQEWAEHCTYPDGSPRYPPPDRVGPTRGRALPPGNVDDPLCDDERADQPLPATLKIEVAKMDELKKQGVLIPRGRHETDR